MSSESNKGKRSRRQFLADALFLGGALTASAFVAKVGFSDSSDPGTTSQGQGKIDETPLAGEPSMPLDGDVAMPEESTPEFEPQLAGRIALPKSQETPCPPTDGPYPGEMMPPRGM